MNKKQLLTGVLVKIHRKIPLVESYSSKATGLKPVPLLQ